jgi:cobalt-zinc-cadmium efflux system outer membrane protein
MPLPVFDKNQGTIRQAEVRLAQTDAQRNSAFLRAQAAVYRLYQELQASRVRLETLRNEALPQAQQALDQTQFGYDRGRFSYLELATAQQELLELRAAIIEAAADYHRTLTEIERLTGEPVSVEAR